VCFVTRSQRGYTGCGQAFRRALMDRRGRGREEPLWEEADRLREPSSAAEQTTLQPDGTPTARKRSDRPCRSERTQVVPARSAWKSVVWVHRTDQPAGRRFHGFAERLPRPKSGNALQAFGATQGCAAI